MDSRILKLNLFDEDKFKKIRKSKILIVGCGGVGSNLATLLARSNFLNLYLCDFDFVDKTNLERQTFFKEDLDKLKTKSLEKFLKKINPKINTKLFNNKFSKEKFTEFEKEKFNLIIDATDNFEVRYDIHEFSKKNKIDWIYSGAIKTKSVSYIFYYNENKFDKIFPKNVCDEKCCEVGVLPSTVLISASLVYNNILKYFLKKENKFISFDSFNNNFFNLKV